MQIADYDYDLPDDLIAQNPLEQRDASRMLIVERMTKRWRNSEFMKFPSFVEKGDVIVVNNTRVFPARLVGVREPSGGQVELFLVRQIDSNIWETLARPARKLQIGGKIHFSNGRLGAEVIGIMADGHREVRFEHEGAFHTLLDEIGQTPLPPYIKRPGIRNFDDRQRYQTIYARKRGAIAAPTAGLHFTSEILNEVRAREADVIEITLHVGYGTFEPVRVDDLSQHSVSPERYEISPKAAETINKAQKRGSRIFAIGTTTTRALESAVNETGQVRPGARMAELTITPDYTFRVVNALLTNFHLPQSSLLVLVSTFAGRDLILEAYRHAVSAKYRFYSYGDCMLII